jgi:hypothetical protein
MLEVQGSLVSDLISQIIDLEGSAEMLENSMLECKERIIGLENCREKTEVKVSREDMTDKVAVSVKQFKLLDIDFKRRQAKERTCSR